jgi:outer membrane protein assembly factor BamB
MVFDASYEGNRFTPLALLAPLPEGVRKVHKDAARWANRRGWSEKRKVVWQDKQGRRFASFVVSPELLLAAGDVGEDSKTSFLVAMQVGNGEITWSETLPAQPVKGGAAINHQGHIIVTLNNGQTLCYSAP